MAGNYTLHAAFANYNDPILLYSQIVSHLSSQANYSQRNVYYQSGTPFVEVA
jgi:hypothetical protein